MQAKEYRNLEGVPDFDAYAFADRQSENVLLIPVINEGERIHAELARAKAAGIGALVDIVLCDGGSTDGSTGEARLRAAGVNTLLVKRGPGKQGAQLRNGFWWALERGYTGLLTIDGNNKDSIEDVPRFLQKLDEGYDFVQGSRFVPGGAAINTPLSRLLAVKLLHAPVISLTARHRFTDTTNAYRAHSRRYLTHEGVQPFRDVFQSYELLAYLSVRWASLGLRACEVPVTRAYPDTGGTPTKISPIRGNWQLLKTLFANAFGKFNP